MQSDADPLGEWTHLAKTTSKGLPSAFMRA